MKVQLLGVPRMRYLRIAADLPAILQKERCSSFHASAKILAVCTHSGFLHLLDHSGTAVKRVAVHTSTIMCVAVDVSSEFVCCVTSAGVMIYEISTEQRTDIPFPQVLTCIALDPEFKRTRQYAVGTRDGAVLMSSKGFLGGAKTQTIHDSSETILSAHWHGVYLCWSDPHCVRVFDTATSALLTQIQSPTGRLPKGNTYLEVLWESPTRMVVAWPSAVEVVEVKENKAKQGAAQKYVEIVNLIQVPFTICGIGLFDGGYALLSNSTNPATSPSPELHIVNPQSVELAVDVVVMGSPSEDRGTYSLHYDADSDALFVVCGTDAVVVRPCEVGDSISWLIEHERFEEASALFAQCNGQMNGPTRRKVVTSLISRLLEKGEHKQAAQCCREFVRDDAFLWERVTFLFFRARRLEDIVEILPESNPRLSSTVYEIVLNHYINTDHTKLLAMLKRWPSDAFNIENILTAVLQRLKNDRESGALLDALAELYLLNRQYDQTLLLCLRLRRGDVFELINKHNLFDSVVEKVSLLIAYDRERAVKLLLDNIDKISISRVVNQLSDKPDLQHAYLSALFKRDTQIGKDFHELQVSLYARYEPNQLLSFLRTSNYYPLEKALQTCEQRRLYPEMVYLLGRMGNYRQALSLLIEKIGDVKEAVEFVQAQQDEELWEDLINSSTKNAAFVSGLLEHIGGYIDPIRLISRIPDGMEITGLRDRLVKIISDYNLEMSLREGCNIVLKADCVNLSDRLMHGKRYPACVLTTSACSSCGARVVGMSANDTALVVFFCGHVYHRRCMRSHPSGGEALHCNICSTQQLARPL